MLSKNKIKLIHSLEKKKNRIETGLFLIEGDKIINEALDQKFIEISELFVTTDFEGITNMAHPICIVEKEQIKQASFLKHPQNAIALAKIPTHRSLPTGGNIVILDDIQDPGNLGTIVRICDWYGINHIVCSEHSVDIFNPKSVQATMGSIFRISVHYTNLETYLPQLSIPKYAAVLEGDNVYKMKWTEECALIIGNEGNGISEKIIQLCDAKITIPNLGGAESLNASTAAAILVSEINRSKLL
jgi:TrmH family RNA methyltransferase